MFRRYRQRRGPYALAAPSAAPSIVRSLILLAVVLLILYFLARWILWLFGVGGDEQRTAVAMQVEPNGTVSVSLEGGLLQRAEDSLKLFPGDRVTTSGNGHARLQFFDGTLVRTDVQSDLTVTKSAESNDASAMQIDVVKGAVWVRTPMLDSFSGAITRIIDMPRYTVTLTSDTEAVIEENDLMIFSADGNGVTVAIDGVKDPVTIGEGQQLSLPEGTVSGDPLRYRSAIEPLAAQREFIQQSRAIVIAQPVTGSGSTASDSAMLTVSEPADKTVLTTATVTVRGTIDPRVERVRVNGYDAVINRADASFSQELSLKDTGDTQLSIEALDARGIVLDSQTRTVTRGTQSIESPTITSPAKNGETYRTQKTEFAISGTVPTGAAGVMVNDYKLQLFRSGDKTWSYLASTALNNLKQGTNTFDVYTLDAAGNKSLPARITILLEPGTEGVVSGGTASAGSTTSTATVDESQLPKNAPLLPGTLKVTAPSDGTPFTATGSEYLIEGTTSVQTASVWVNGYKLQLYKPGKTYWNYIAKAEYNTLKPGNNVYKITARNEKGEILDTFEYTITYRP